MLAWLRKDLLNFLKPLLRGASGVHMPFTHKLVTGRQYYAARANLKPGSIFVSKIRGELTGILIPGYWSHAAIYSPVPRSPDEMVMEAEGPGVIETDLVTFVMGKDCLAILDPGLPDEVMARAAAIATEQLGKPYDYDFEFNLSNQEAFYCSELVWWCYDKACEEFKIPSPFKPRMSLGVATVTPDDIALDFKTIWDSRRV
jgi:hypothetical protein